MGHTIEYIGYTGGGRKAKRREKPNKKKKM
jgi:hypothetical protein